MYGASQALSSDSTSVFASNSETKEDLAVQYRELFMDSDSSYGGNEYRHQYQQGQSNSGGSLLRFRSAPGSLFANFTDGVEKIGANNSTETQGLVPSRFSSNGAKCNSSENKALLNGYAAINLQLPPQYPRQSSATQLGSMDGGYRVVSSMGMDHQGQAKMGTNLMRQNSSPAGLFSHLTQNGYATTRGAGICRGANGTSGDLSQSSSRIQNQMNYSSGLSSSLGMLSRISEVENENCGATGADEDEKLGNENGDAQLYGAGYPFSTWNDSSNFDENFTGLKREADDDVKSFADSQNGELRNRPSVLSHHLSLPKSSAEMEKLLHFQDTVPCKIRAKRGCATHPRSIAERVRRTRISERMRKLQDLVPNMDKQTNTADMLDLAVDYIKDLQKQYKTLADTRANCKCPTLQNSVLNQTS